ncbi:MAG: hypothetical protein JO179_07015 [Solirubrobacterales bacterium]|nr:hypothetical protein [Solirubrobacterales bacterium]
MVVHRLHQQQAVIDALGLAEAAAQREARVEEGELTGRSVEQYSAMLLRVSIATWSPLWTLIRTLNDSIG